MTTKLSDTQRAILEAAADHPKRLAAPPPKLPPAPRASIRKSLLEAGLIEEAPAKGAEATAGWLVDGSAAFYRVTKAGLEAIGRTPPAKEKAPKAPKPPKEPKPPRVTKGAQVIEMLRSPDGGTAATIGAATGWLPHTIRAFVSQLPKQGFKVTTEKLGKGAGSTTIWRIAAEGGAA